MRWTRVAAATLLATLGACGGGGGGGGADTSGGSAPASVDPRLVGSYEASRWFYDYPSGQRVGNEDFDSTTWRMHLRADGRYDIHKEWWREGEFTAKQDSGQWSVGPATETDAEGTLLLRSELGQICTEAFPFSLPSDPDVALEFWRANGPTCDGTKPYLFYLVEWARVD